MTLTLLRHAKSSWEDASLRDMERPLNRRGLRDAPLMGRLLSAVLSPPDRILTSPAQRTRETVAFLCGSWGIPSEVITEVERLYLAGVGDFYAVLEEHGARADHLLVCGHNPGIADFAHRLCPDFSGAMPTAAAVSFRLPGDDWSEIGERTAEIVFQDIPKNHRRG